MGNKRVKRITIEELEEEIQFQIWEFGCNGFVIKEDFPKYKREFRVEDLHIEFDDEYVLFYDYDGKLFSSVLASVLKESILSIYHNRTDNIMHEEILLDSGYVYIDSIAS